MKANRRFRQLVSPPVMALDPLGYIDMTDVEGGTIARLVMAESFAAMRCATTARAAPVVGPDDTGLTRGLWV